MKYLTAALIYFLIPCSLPAQSKITGAWHLQENGNTKILMFQDGYFTSSSYNDTAFIGTWGGPFKISNNKIRVNVEFNSTDKENIGTNKQLSYSLKNNVLEVDHQPFKKVSDEDEPLAGVWKITDRMQDGKLTPIHRSGPRKTLKMLTGHRFQWFAINPETKEFFGAGGGTYSFKDGKYTENIEFFSRDQSRVGAQLVFDGKLENGKWHHSGLSSRGDKIYEVWGRD